VLSAPKTEALTGREGLQGRSAVPVRRHGGFTSCGGRFDLASGPYPSLGDDYELRLDDGRSAAMVVLVVRTGSHRQPVADFKLSGGLK
jgi:hypothetical protein